MDLKPKQTDDSDEIITKRLVDKLDKLSGFVTRDNACSILVSNYICKNTPYVLMGCFMSRSKWTVLAKWAQDTV